MNIYELNRTFVDFSFENPTKIKPIHYAIYFFTIEHCNRLGWKKHFGLPSQMVMEAIGVLNWRTYIKALNELVDYGFIKFIEKSKNQYSSNVVMLTSATVKNTKALDKALQKHSTKHSTKQSRSIVSIDKQLYNITNIQKSFLVFWSKYPKKVAKQKCEKQFLKLKDSEVKTILETIDSYIAYKPFKDYVHPNPSTYLNQRRWEDEVKKIEKPKEIIKITRSDFYTD